MIRLQVGNLDLVSGQNTLGTIRDGFRPPTTYFGTGYTGSSSVLGTACRVAVNSSGVVYVYVANPATATTLRCSVSYPV